MTSTTPSPAAPAVQAGPLLAQLRNLQDAFAEQAAATSPEIGVPGLGSWTVRDLVLHLAGIHHWAAGMAMGDRSRTTTLEVDPGASSAELATLYAGHAAALHSTLATATPDAAARTLVGPGTASFWFRRQVHETLIHLGDLAAARPGAWTLGVFDGVPGISAALWADGVSEVVTMFEPRQVHRGHIAPLSQLIALRDTATGTHWVLGAHEPGRAPSQRPAAIATGEARALDLMLWGRLTPAQAGVVVDGDRTALDDALAAGITP